jgi:hypothetical protein
VSMRNSYLATKRVASPALRAGSMHGRRWRRTSELILRLLNRPLSYW